jgi:hypothetical protein
MAVIGIQDMPMLDRITRLVPKVVVAMVVVKACVKMRA